MIIVVLIMATFTLSGCFFGSSGSDDDHTHERILQADFSMKESSGQLYLNASSTKVEGYTDPEYAWEVNETNYSGEKVDMTQPDTETKIKLIVKAHRDNDAVTDTKTKTYKPGTIVDGDVDFSYSRIGNEEYKFVGSEPSGAVYWEWRIEGHSSWYGYKNDNVYTHKFSSSGDKKIELRILDGDENIIGYYEETINVY